MTQDIKQAITDAKILLIREFPFMSFMVMTTTYIEDNSMPTMAATVVNGQPIVLYNKDFTIKNLKTEGTIAFVLAHEILHIYLQHLGRQKLMGYNHKLWNIAADYCINRGLIELDSKKLTTPNKSIGILDDKKFTKMSADEIYAFLLNENDNDPKKACEKCGVPFDEVSFDSLSEEEKAELKAKLSASLNQNRNFGDSSSNLFKMLKVLIEPRLDWKQILREYIFLSAKSRYTYKKYNRRSTDVIFPGVIGESIDMAIGIDTSGSMTDNDLTEAYSELRSIVVNFDSWKVSLISCDTIAHIIGEYSFDEGHDIETISKSLIGGGGTDLNPIVKMCEDLENKPSVLVIITDGGIPMIVGSELIPTIIIVTSLGNTNFQYKNIDKIIKIEH